MSFPKVPFVLLFFEGLCGYRDTGFEKNVRANSN
jgi:hypothetical protein